MGPHNIYNHTLQVAVKTPIFFVFFELYEYSHTTVLRVPYQNTEHLNLPSPIVMLIFCRITMLDLLNVNVSVCGIFFLVLIYKINP